MTHTSATGGAALLLKDNSPVGQVVAGLKNLIQDEIPSAHDIAFKELARSAVGLSRENWSPDAIWTEVSGRHARR
jgi:hypothetical protein